MNEFVNAEDSDLWMKLGTAPGFVHVKAPLLFAYRNHPESASKIDARTFAGIRQLVLKERTAKYPGGPARQRERRQILGAHVRSTALGCLAGHNFRGALWLYQSTFWWHVLQARFKYLAGFWLIALRKALPRVAYHHSS
jgi:hypothetical protein